MNEEKKRDFGECKILNKYEKIKKAKGQSEDFQNFRGEENLDFVPPLCNNSRFLVPNSLLFSFFSPKHLHPFSFLLFKGKNLKLNTLGTLKKNNISS
jgi:hypothetical protein